MLQRDVGESQVCLSQGPPHSPFLCHQCSLSHCVFRALSWFLSLPPWQSYWPSRPESISPLTSSPYASASCHLQRLLVSCRQAVRDPSWFLDSSIADMDSTGGVRAGVHTFPILRLVQISPELFGGIVVKAFVKSRGLSPSSWLPVGVPAFSCSPRSPPFGCHLNSLSACKAILVTDLWNMQLISLLLFLKQ